MKPIPPTRVDGWDDRPPLYIAPPGRRIVGLRSFANDKIVEVTLDNGEVVRVETGVPRFTTVH